MLYSVWSGYVTGVAVVGAFGTIVNTRIAAYAAEGDIRTVAYMAATISAVAAVGWVANAIPELLHYRATLREAEAN